MAPGLKITSLATLMMSAALFTRRSRDGWLDELDSIRGEALSRPQGEVDDAMSAFVAGDSAEPARSWADTSPLSEIEHPLPPARVAPVPVADVAPPPAPVVLSGPDHELPGAARATAPDLATPDLVVSDPATLVLQSAPNPSRPHEMWHADVVLPTLSLTPDGVLPVDPADHRPPSPSSDLPAASDPADPVDGSEQGSRFRLGRLRAVFRHGEEEPNTSTVADTLPANGAEPQSLLSELLSQYGDDDMAQAVAATVAPLAESSMFAQPVTRRDDHDVDLAPRRDVSATWEAPSVPASPLVLADLVAPVEEVVAEPVTEPDPEPQPQLVEPVPVAVETVELAIGPDGTAELAAGHLRLPAGWSGTIARTGDQISLDLPTDACWTVLGPDATETVVVSTPSAEVALVAGSRTLTVVEADGSSFVLVLSGTASLIHPGGRLELPTGTMVLTAVDASPQVDGASPEELRSDAAVAGHLLLDATR